MHNAFVDGHDIVVDYETFELTIGGDTWDLVNKFAVLKEHDPADTMEFKMIMCPFHGEVGVEAGSYKEGMECPACSNNDPVNVKIGAYDPCPCGSGKKFKFCCK